MSEQFQALKVNQASASTSTVVISTLRRDIVVVLSVKTAIVLVCALFVFGPHQRPRITAEAASHQILNEPTGSRQEP